MGELVGSTRVAYFFLWYFSIVLVNSMFFLLITCYIPWTFRREHCPPWRKHTTRTPGAHREACGHLCPYTTLFRSRKITWTISDAIIPALKHRIPSELRS